MLELTGFLGLARIPLGFWAHTDLTDPTVLLCGWEISQMLLCVGCAHADSAWFLGSHGSHRSHGIALWVGNLTDASACGLAHTDLTFWAHTDLTDPTVSLCGWEISQMILRVWTCVGSDGGTLLSLSRTYLLDPSDKSDLSDKSDGLDIFKNNP